MYLYMVHFVPLENHMFIHGTFCSFRKSAVCLYMVRFVTSENLPCFYMVHFVTLENLLCFYMVHFVTSENLPCVPNPCFL